jgi:6,7-dimethyl-8-ribityllumazine synthase
MSDSIRTIEGDMNARGLRVGVVAARFNDFIVDRLLAGAVSTLLKHGVDSAIIALGCVIRGATPHFDYVAGEAASGISAACLKYEIPVSFGVLTVDTIEQAIERAGTKAGNKGVDAALSAIETATLLKRLEQ